jgi:hypothetical protein
MKLENTERGDRTLSLDSYLVKKKTSYHRAFVSLLFRARVACSFVCKNKAGFCFCAEEAAVL